MATSDVSICNIALRNLGAQPISALTDDTLEANLCSDYFEPFRDEVLSEHQWDFATRWDSLAEDATYVFDDDRFIYAYDLPTDYIKIVRTENDAEYEIRADDASGTSKLVCNITPCVVQYVYQHTDMTKWPPFFIRALVARLRIDLAIPLLKRGTKKIDWQARYSEIDLPEAKTQDALQSNQTNEFIHGHTNDTEEWNNL